MKMKVLAILLTTMMLILTGCSSSPFSPDGPTATVNPAFLQDTPMAGPINLDMLKNLEYVVQNGMKLAELVDGKYESGTGAEYISVTMQDLFGIGDLNSDGRQDAAVILAENYGGTGTFVYLVPVFDSGGSLSASSGTFLGDRVMVNSLGIEAGTIKMEIRVHAPNDSLCCPSQEMTQDYRFYSGPGLVMVNATSRTLDNSTREITIESPGQGADVGVQFQLRGKVAIAPFENTLLMNVVDMNNMASMSNPLMVSAAEMGAPGTFDTTVDLSGLSPTPGSRYRIELVENSMADGSILCMDSVEIVYK